MKRYLSLVFAAVLALSMLCIPASAENPTITTSFTPDPAPMVYNDTFYFYTGHDADNASYYTMTDWQCFSSTDMKNWVNHGSVLHDYDFSWAKADSCWAAQCIERDGKFYLYVTLEADGDKIGAGGRAIGVAVSDSPTGPFKDALGKPLCGPDWTYIDPTVLIDDDGQAYLYFGNPTLYYVKLKKNMIECDGPITACEMTGAQFGKNDNMPCLYTEGPWIYKRDGLYYMIYAASAIPETIDYAVSTSPTGPWEYKGRIMGNYTSFTIHPGVAEYKGHAYFTYHSADISNGNGFCRSGAIDEFTFGTNGEIPLITPTREGPAQIEYFNPYLPHTAVTMCTQEGIKVVTGDTGSIYATKCSSGDYIRLAGVNFAERATSLTANASAIRATGTIEVRLDSPDGTLVGTLEIAERESDEDWQEVSCDISSAASGVHDLYFVFDASVNRGYVNFLSWQFDGIYTEDDFPPAPVMPVSGGRSGFEPVVLVCAIGAVIVVGAFISIIKRKSEE